MKTFDLTIITGPYVEPWTATVYEPFDGAEFVAQRPLRGPGWRVTHRRTTFFVGEDQPTRKAALEIAAELSRHCPSAAKVRVRADEGGRHVALIGPHRKLRAEIRALNVITEGR